MRIARWLSGGEVFWRLTGEDEAALTLCKHSGLAADFCPESPVQKIDPSSFSQCKYGACPTFDFLQTPPHDRSRTVVLAIANNRSIAIIREVAAVGIPHGHEEWYGTKGETMYDCQVY